MRERVVTTPEAKAKAYADGMRSASQCVAYLQCQDKTTVDGAHAATGVDPKSEVFADLQRVVERVKLWELTGEKPVPGGTKPAKDETKAAKSETKTAMTDAEKEHVRWELVRKIRGKELKQINKVLVSEAAVEAAKGNLKCEEAELERIRQELGRAIDGSPIQMELPLEVEKVATPVTDDAWRAVTLASIGIKESTLKKLADHEPAIGTIGQLCDWQQKKGEFWAKDIKGIGAAANKEICDALDKYWAANPRKDAEPKKELPPAAAAATSTEPPSTTTPDAASGVAPADGFSTSGDTWRTTKLSVVLSGEGVSFHGLGQLHDKEVTTLGHIEDATADGENLENLLGIGPKKTTKIFAAIRAWAAKQYPGFINDMPLALKEEPVAA